MEARKEMTVMVLTLGVGLLVLTLFVLAGKADHEIERQQRHS